MNNKTAYLFSGGGFVLASNAKEFAEKMRHTSMNKEKNLAEFMDAVAHRCHLDNASYIRTDTYDAFLEDLIDHEFVIAITLD
jgi:hypothetical protein